jgi:release factor glutamine methyltransferase
MAEGQPVIAHSAAPASGPAQGADRLDLVASITDRVGSKQEAVWIVEHGGVDQARALADRRAAGEPLQYVLGHWPFRSVELRVDRRALIPRPETERVVEVALVELDRICRRPAAAVSTMSITPVVRGSHLVCVDLGTGSGAIALSLAVEGGAMCPDIQIWAADDSLGALELAGENICDLAADDAPAAARVRLVHGSWFDPLPPELLGRVDLVVSNPPYVGVSEYPGLDPSVREWEPERALVADRGAGGVDGMAAIEAILAGAPRWLSGGGAVVVEIAPRQADPAVDAARRAGFGQVATRRDLAGRLRMLVARR